MDLEHPLEPLFREFRLLLGSSSPRRSQLLRQMGLPFTQVAHPIDEVYPSSLVGREIPEYLSTLKAQPFFTKLKSTELLLTADTVVLVDDHCLEKPENEEEAQAMLRMLSGRTHQVISAVCLSSIFSQTIESDSCSVTFRTLSEEEIKYYITQNKPVDKAGAYGIQDWIGLIGIQRIEGSFFTVMGLPTHLVYELLRDFWINRTQNKS